LNGYFAALLSWQGPINDPEAALRLKAHAAELLERAGALDEQKGED
jgi:hypothetical protein